MIEKGEIYEAGDGGKVEVADADRDMGLPGLAFHSLDEDGNILHPDSPRANTKEMNALKVKLMKEWKQERKQAR